METSSVAQTISNESIVSFVTLPVELIVRVFSYLATFFDLFALDSTCQRLRGIWLDNTNTICNAVELSGAADGTPVVPTGERDEDLHQDAFLANDTLAASLLFKAEFLEEQRRFQPRMLLASCTTQK